MKCPACTNALSNMLVDDVNVDVCKGGCGGIWFDNYEFKKFDEPHEEAGLQLLEIEQNENITPNLSDDRSCPKCNDVTLKKHFFSVKREVEIDSCSHCGGAWIDTGELAEVRSMFSSESERHVAAEAIFSDLFGPQLQKLKDAREDKNAKVERFLNVVKFICPSYYIPDEQDWGSF